MAAKRKRWGGNFTSKSPKAYSRAAALLAEGQLGQALAVCKDILAVHPSDVLVIDLLGRIMAADRQFDVAVRAFEQALTLEPDFLAAFEGLGMALRKQGNLSGAEACFWRMTIQQPGLAAGHSNLGAVLNNQGRAREAVEAHYRAVELEPRNAAAHSNYLFSLQYDPESTFEQRLCAAQAFGRRIRRTDRRRHHRSMTTADPEKRLRIGYVSPDLGQHPVGVFLEGALVNHEPDQFDVLCYSDRLKEDDLTQRLRMCCQTWRRTSGMTDKAMAQLIRADKIDILADLAGHTARNRLAVFALKPAPVQVSWLGYGDTTGLETIEYVISDGATIPPGGERWFVETPFLLPQGRFCYKPPDYAPPVAPLPARIRGKVTFGSFNNLTKLNDEVVDLWAEVVKAVPGARLLLKENSLKHERERKRIAERFAAHGLNSERLELRGPDGHADMLEQYGDIDVALDPFPFCGGLTSCEALWQGVPVVTLIEERPIGRQTYGFLIALGLSHLAAADRSDYLRVATGLSEDLDALAELRSGLRARMRSSPLCDCAGFTRHLEDAYRTIWRRYCAVSGTPAPELE